MESEGRLEVEGIFSFCRYRVFINEVGFRFIRLLVPVVAPYNNAMSPAFRNMAQGLLDRQMRLVRTGVFDEGIRVMDIALINPDYCLPDIAIATCMFDYSPEKAKEMQRVVAQTIRSNKKRGLELHTESLDFVTSKMKEAVHWIILQMQVPKEHWTFCSSMIEMQ